MKRNDRAAGREPLHDWIRDLPPATAEPAAEISGRLRNIPGAG